MTPSSIAKFRDRIPECILAGAGLVSALAVLAIIGFLIFFAAPLFTNNHILELLTWTWNPSREQFGILPMVVGSFALGSAAIGLAFPMGLAVAIFTEGLAPSMLGKILTGFVRLMTGIPTVVYGFVAAFLLVPWVRESFSYGAGFSFLAATLTLSVLIVPTIVLLTQNQIRVVQNKTQLITASLGIERKLALFRVVLPLCRKGLLSVLLLAFGRAIGDAMIPLMLAGNAPQIIHSPLDAMRTLSAHIALVVATDSQSLAYQSLFAAGIILFVTSSAVNLFLRAIDRRTIP